MSSMSTHPDPIFKVIAAESLRQRSVIDLIPSENHASPAVHRAVGSVLMHKYAEGYPRARYYQGNEQADQVEQLCRDRALATFGLNPSEWGVNVQAYSGSGANLAIYNALLQPGDKIMAMYLPDGGHLSHGWGFKDFKTLVRKLYTVEFYHVDPKTEVFDYDAILKQAKKYRPKMLISGGTAYPRQIDHVRMGQIARQVGALYLADVSHEGGLIAGRVNDSPFPHADVVMMTTHKTLRGPRAALIFGRRSPLVAAGNLGLSQSETADISKLIDKSIFPGMQGGPHLHSIAGVAVALAEAQQPAFRVYAKQILKNAQVLAKDLAKAGYRVVSGSVEKHLVLLDLRGSGAEAWIAAWALEAAGIILNRNTVPNDTGSPYYPSGLRLGTPIVTTRGMKQSEMHQIAAWIIQVLEYSKRWQLPEDAVERKAFLKDFKKQLPRDRFLGGVKRQVAAFAKKYPSFAV